MSEEILDLFSKPILPDIQKARVVVPVGTIHEIGINKYIKTNDGWRYYKDPGKSKGPEEENPKDKGPKPSPVEPGHRIKASDGTEGKVIERDGKETTIEYKKDGETKTAKVENKLLDTRREQGRVEHSPTSLKPHHHEFIKDSLKDDKSGTHIVSRLKEQGVEEDHAMNAVLDHQKELRAGDRGQKIDSKETPANKKEETLEGDIHEDHDTSVKHQAENITDHDGFMNTKQLKKLVASYANKENEKKEGFSVKQPETLVKVDTKNPLVTKESEKEMEEIDSKFSAFSRQVRSVLNGSMKGSLVYGSGGVGKTYTVTKELEKAGKKPFRLGIDEPGDDSYDYIKITGRVTPVSLYQMINQHPGKILMFDDCNSVLEDKTSLDLLKGMLDTSGDGTVTWGSGNAPKSPDTGEVLPQQTQFTGKVIFCTNMPIKEMAKKDKDLGAVLTRGPSLDLTMTPQQTINRIKSIAWNPKEGKLNNLQFPGTPNYDEKDLKDAIQYLEDNQNQPGLDISVRSIGTLLGLQKEAKADGVDWKKDAGYALGIEKSQSGYEIRKNFIDSTYGKSNRNELIKSRVEKYSITPQSKSFIK